MNIHPSNIKTVTINIVSKKKSASGRIAFPPDLIKRHNLKDKQEVVIALLCLTNMEIEEFQKGSKQEEKKTSY